MTTPAADWSRVTELFDQLLPLSDADRGGVLDTVPGPVREAVQQLLDAMAAEGGRFGGHAFDLLADDGADAGLERLLADLPPGTRVGPYELVREVGRGGMGVVYEARRADDAFAMRLAIKLLRRDADSALAVRRFRRERQILATLSHPNIVPLLDGGMTATGTPYLAMAYVDGEPITRHAAARRLPVRQRLALLLQVCRAVQHAHGRLVVHRDLKPGNILVSDEGQVHLLDFGIARLVRRDDGAEALPTEATAVALTPDYASPEQFAGLPPQPASDIYALGAIAYELLAGRRPFTLAGLPWAEAQRLVTTTTPPPPSTAVRDAPPESFGERSAAAVARTLRGDLDAIVLQAMHADPARRYPTVEALATDLEAVLAGRPVRARRDSAGYRLGKLLRRRPLESAAVGVAALALVAGTVVSVRAARRADAERRRTEQVNGFLQRMLASADPDSAGRDVTVRVALQQAARDLSSGTMADDLRADLLHTVAVTYYGLGVWDSAASVGRQAFDLRRRLHGEADARTAQLLALRAAAEEGRGAYAQADSLAGAAVALHKRARPMDAVALAEALDTWARVVDAQGHPERSEALQLEAIAVLQPRSDTAARLLLSTVLTNLAVSRTYQGRSAEAESLQVAALAIARALHGTETARYADFERALADILEARGAYGAADSLMRHALGVMRDRLGPTHTTFLRAQANAARLRLRSGDPAGAITLAESVTTHIGRALPETDITSASVLQFLGAALDSAGRHAEAEVALRRAWALRAKGMPAGHWAIASAEATVGAHLLLVGRHAEAEPLLRRGYDGVVATHGAASAYGTAIARRLALLYRATGRIAEASRWEALATPPPAPP